MLLSSLLKKAREIEASLNREFASSSSSSATPPSHSTLDPQRAVSDAENARPASTQPALPPRPPSDHPPLNRPRSTPNLIASPDRPTASSSPLVPRPNAAADDSASTSFDSVATIRPYHASSPAPPPTQDASTMLHSENQRLSKLLDDYTREKQQLLTLNQSLQNDLVTTIQLEKETLEREYRGKITALEHTMDIIKTKAKEKVSTLAGELRCVKMENEALRKEVEKNNGKGTDERVGGEIDECKIRERVENGVDDMKRKGEAKDERIRQLEREVEALRQRDVAEKYAMTETSTDKTFEEMEELRRQLAKVHDDFELERSRCASLQQEIERLKQQQQQPVNESAVDDTHFISRIQDLENEVAKKHDLEVEYVALRAQISQLQQDLMSRQEAHQKEIETITRQFHEHGQAANATQEKEVDELRHHVASLQEKIAIVESKADADIASKNQMIAQMNHTVEVHLKTIAELQSRVDAVSSQNTQSSSELENRNFTLEEQNKDLKIQLASKSTELSKLQDVYQKLKDDHVKMSATHDEKMKKIKGLFMVANKNINDQKEQLAQKESDVAKLSAELDDLKHANEQLKLDVHNRSVDATRLETDLQSQTTVAQLKIDELQRDLDVAKEETTHIKLEFQKYKVRAQSVFNEKSNDGFEKRIRSLEQKNTQLEQEYRQALVQVDKAHQKVQALEDKLQTSLQHAMELEHEKQQLARLVDDNAELQGQLKAVERNLKQLRVEHQEELARERETWNEMVAKVKEEMRIEKDRLSQLVRVKQTDYDELQKISDRLNTELATLKEKLKDKETEVEYLQNVAVAIKNRSPNYSAASMTAVTELAPSGRSDQSATSNNPHPMRPLEDILTESVQSLQSPESVASQNEIKMQELAELLVDSEALIGRLQEQEKFLKEEIRRLERSDKRQNLNMDYLKNLVLKLAEAQSTEREALHPVLCQILHLDPEEAGRLRNALSQSSSFWPL